jgi:ribose transport system substrate-binding protein
MIRIARAKKIKAVLTALSLVMLFGIGALLSPSADAADVKVALVPGGPHPFFAPWEQAAADAKKDFNLAACDYKVPQEWKLDLQNKLLESLAAQGYNAFGIFPGDATGTNATMQELLDFGDPSVAIGGCTQSPSPAQFCLATDVYRSVYIGTKQLIKEMGGKGSILHVASRLVDPNTVLRIAAVDRAIKEAGPDVKLYQHLTDTDSQETGDQKINGLLAAKAAEIDGIISTGYVSSVVAARSLRNIGDKRIKMIGIDDDPIVLQAIKDGYLQGTMAQNPYGQGYIAAYVLKRLREGCKIKDNAPFQETAQNKTFIDSGTLLITVDNIDTYKDELKSIAKDIISSFEAKYLTCK